ncbi:MAG TPA: DUF998 domain-containing protein [Solirubrobacterales bacterium]|nr:DUF998 domain-containing protein [Solirubrobacterales bacterium]
MRRPAPIALAGIGAGLLCNYWALEGALAERSDFDSSWISDLATRTESTGWRFVVLGILSGLAIAAFALALLRRLTRSDATGAERTLRLGLWALLASGLFTVLASAAPLSCAEGLEPTCSLAYDPVDVLHSLATAGEIAATVLAFLLVGLGLLTIVCPLSPRGRQRTRGRWIGWLTLALGALWLLLTALTGVTYLGDALDSVKGALQRADQVVFGAWLVLLGFAARCGRGGPGAGEIPGTAPS